MMGDARTSNNGRRALQRFTLPLAAIVLALIGSMMAGCGHSPPTHYVTLSAMPAAGTAPSATAPIPPVQLTAVHIPAELDRREVVTEVSANRVSIDDNTRWDAPLAQTMRRTLAQDLLSRLPAGAFLPPDTPAPPGTRTLVVTVLDTHTDANGTLTFQASWALMSGQPAHVALSRQTTLTSAEPNLDATAQAAALSGILGQLADQIATSVQMLAKD